MKRKFRVTVEGETFLVEVEEIDERRTVPQTEVAQTAEPATRIRRLVEPPTEAMDEVVVTAPLPGVVSEVNVSEGDRVEAGSVLLVLEAMKMENEIYAPAGGVVRKVFVNVGVQVGRGDRLVLIS